EGTIRNYQIYVAKVDGSDAPIKITNANSTRNVNPQITPDGTKVIWFALTNYSSNNKYQIYVANTDGSGIPTKISDADFNNGEEFNLQVSNDGTKVIWSGSDESLSIKNVFVANIDGTGTPLKLARSSKNSINHRIIDTPEGTKVSWKGVD